VAGVDGENRKKKRRNTGFGRPRKQRKNLVKRGFKHAIKGPYRGKGGKKKKGWVKTLHVARKRVKRWGQENRVNESTKKEPL